MGRRLRQCPEDREKLAGLGRDVEPWEISKKFESRESISVNI